MPSDNVRDWKSGDTHLPFLVINQKISIAKVLNVQLRCEEGGVFPS